LAALHAHHVHLSRLASRNRDNEDIESRLRQSIAKRTGLEESDGQVSSQLDQILLLARSRARRKVQYHGHKVGEIDLATLSEIKNTKETELQKLSDHSIALGFLSMQHINKVLTFQTETSQTLQYSLESEALGANDYVNVLQWFIVNSPPSETADSFSADVKEACGIKGNVTNSYLLTEVEDLIKTAHEREKFLASATLKTALKAETEIDELIRQYQADQEQLNQKSISLLTRKIAKMDNTIVQDIETLTKEANMFASIGD